MNSSDYQRSESAFWQHREAQGNSVPVLPTDPGAYFFERVEYTPFEKPTQEEQERYVRVYFELDDALGNFLLGECYRHGRGVSQSYDKAIWWFLRGAENAENQKRRLNSAAAFYLAAPWNYERAYAIEKGRAKVFEPYLGEEIWLNFTPRQLALGLQRLTEYEESTGKLQSRGN